MYPEYKDGIVKDCKESYSPLMVLIENLLHISTWVAAGWSGRFNYTAGRF